MLRLKRFSEGTWVDYPDCPGVRLKIRALPLVDLLSMQAKHKRKLPVTFEDGRSQIVDDLKEDIIWDQFDYILQGWEGIEIEGNPSPEEQKRAIFQHTPIVTFVFNKVAEIDREQVDKFQGELKNSKRSRNG